MVGAPLMLAGGVDAQELEPRAYSPSPVGTTFAVFGFGRSEGPILLDPALNTGSWEGELWMAAPGIGYVFAIAGRQARVLAVSPIAWGAIERDTNGSAGPFHLAGFADPRFKFSIWLRGAPAESVADFARTPRRAVVVGASMTIAAPLGQYHATQLVNLGLHQWALKPELGISRQFGRWTLDAYGGVWLFTANKRYFPGWQRREREPVATVQSHVSYTLHNRSWLAIDATWFSGGQTRINGVRLSDDQQRNGRLGVTLSVPLSGPQSLKFVYNTGATTRRGTAFDSFNVTWQVVRFRNGR